MAGAAAIGVGITHLIDLLGGGADDQIGDVQTVAYTEAQANADTSLVNPFIRPALRFDGGSDDGIYDVTLALERSSPL